MARLPQPGADNGQWGDILNDYLRQSHKADGTLATDSVTADAIAPGAVSKTDVGLSNVTNTADTDKPVSGPQQTALAAKLNITDLDTQTAAKISDTASATSSSLTALSIALLGKSIDPLSIASGTITRNASDAPTSFAVEWPDGTAGVYTGIPSVAFPSAIDSYTLTYVGTSGTKTFTQPTVTRNASGYITNRPKVTMT